MTITEHQIAAYLETNPDFFVEHPNLVRSLKIPIESSSAISLVEFQLRKLRERISQLERENDHMVETARINSVLFEKTRTLVLALLDTDDLSDLAIVLDEKLSSGFDIPVVRLLLSSQFELPNNLNLIDAIDRSLLEVGGQFATAISDQKPWVGRVTKERKVALFGSKEISVESCATLALVRGHTYGLLALGHPNATHFQSNQDTLFLDHIGEALAMILPRLLNEAD